MSTKAQIRVQALRLRQQMTVGQYEAYSQIIADKLWAYLAYLKARDDITSVHVYLSHNREPDTLGIIKKLIADQYHVYVPVIRQQRLYSVRIVAMDFVTGPYGILEPKTIRVEAEQRYDAIIVPTLAYDSNNNRLGYGKGFYDKFLATQPEARKIGLSYRCNKYERLPVADHDIPLDVIIDEREADTAIDTTIK